MIVNASRASPPREDVEPPKSLDEQIVITAIGELHILASPIQIIIGGEGLQSKGQLHLVADHILDIFLASVHAAESASACKE